MQIRAFVNSSTTKFYLLSIVIMDNYFEYYYTIMDILLWIFYIFLFIVCILCIFISSHFP